MYDAYGYQILKNKFKCVEEIENQDSKKGATLDMESMLVYKYSFSLIWIDNCQFICIKFVIIWCLINAFVRTWLMINDYSSLSLKVWINSMYSHKDVRWMLSHYVYLSMNLRWAPWEIITGYIYIYIYKQYICIKIFSYLLRQNDDPLSTSYTKLLIFHSFLGLLYTMYLSQRLNELNKKQGPPTCSATISSKKK